MKFLVSRSSYPKKTTSVIIEESGEVFFHLELPSGQDTVDGWYIRFLYLRKTQPQELNEFVAIIHRLLEIRVDEEAYSTYLKLMLGLYHWLEKEIEVLQEFGQDQQYLHSLQVNLGNALFRFQQFSETPLVEGSREVNEKLEKIRAEEIKEYTSEVDIHKSPRPLRIFLCHSSGDKPTVRELYQRLKVEGIAPWLDEEDLLPGQNWQREIRNVVRSSDIVIICLSQNSINKVGYVQKEITFALDMADEQPEGTIYLIPLRMEECNIPDRLKHLHWVNYFQEHGFDKLMKAVEFRAKSLISY